MAMTFCVALVIYLKNREGTKKETGSKNVDLTYLSVEQVDSNVFSDELSQPQTSYFRERKKTPTFGDQA